MKKLFWPIFAVLLSPFFACAGPLATETGRQVTVVLCQVSEVPSDERASSFANAEFGLEFVFLILKNSEGEEKFGLKELMDFKISGTSYSQLSNIEIESHTVINEFDDMRDLATSCGISEPGGRCLFMTTKILGGKIEKIGAIRVSPTFAWGGQPEAFTFEVQWSDLITRS